MADKKISELPADSTVTGSEQFPVNDGGVTKRISMSQAKAYAEATALAAANAAQGDADAAQSTANSALAAANAAQDDADAAQDDANAAQSTANTALSNANSAQSTANTALANAGTALSAANSANANANTRILSSAKGAANGVCGLDASAKVPDGNLHTQFYTVYDQTEMLGLAAHPGEICYRVDLDRTYYLSAAPASTLANWKMIGMTANEGSLVLPAYISFTKRLSDNASLDLISHEMEETTTESGNPYETIRIAVTTNQKGIFHFVSSYSAYDDSGFTQVLRLVRWRSGTWDSRALQYFGHGRNCITVSAMISLNVDDKVFVCSAAESEAPYLTFSAHRI